MKDNISQLDKLYYKIGEVSEITGVEPYVLRYWESEFNIVRPSRTKAKQRLYRKKDVELILEIKELLYKEQFTIAGARRKLKGTNSRENKESQVSLSEQGTKDLLKDVKNELQIIKGILEQT